MDERVNFVDLWSQLGCKGLYIHCIDWRGAHKKRLSKQAYDEGTDIEALSLEGFNGFLGGVVMARTRLEIQWHDHLYPS